MSIFPHIASQIRVSTPGERSTLVKNTFGENVEKLPEDYQKLFELIESQENEIESCFFQHHKDLKLEKKNTLKKIFLIRFNHGIKFYSLHDLKMKVGLSSHEMKTLTKGLWSRSHQILNYLINLDQHELYKKLQHIQAKNDLVTLLKMVSEYKNFFELFTEEDLKSTLISILKSHVYKMNFLNSFNFSILIQNIFTPKSEKNEYTFNSYGESFISWYLNHIHILSQEILEQLTESSSPTSCIQKSLLSLLNLTKNFFYIELNLPYSIEPLIIDKINYNMVTYLHILGYIFFSKSKIGDHFISIAIRLRKMKPKDTNDKSFASIFKEIFNNSFQSSKKFKYYNNPLYIRLKIVDRYFDSYGSILPINYPDVSPDVNYILKQKDATWMMFLIDQKLI